MIALWIGVQVMQKAEKRRRDEDIIKKLDEKLEKQKEEEKKNIPFRR